MTTATIEQEETLTSASYARDRERYSFDRMKRLIGAGAIELERQYQGIEELEEIKRQALNQANRLLAFFKKPEIATWPKGWFDEPAEYGCDTCEAIVPKSQLRRGETDGSEVSCCAACRDVEVDESESRETTPLGVALGFSAVDMGAFWCFMPPQSSDAYEIALNVPGFDVFDDENQRVITATQAGYRLEEYGDERLGVVLPEELSLFLSQWSDGLYPELVYLSRD